MDFVSGAVWGVGWRSIREELLKIFGEFFSPALKGWWKFSIARSES